MAFFEGRQQAARLRAILNDGHSTSWKRVVLGPRAPNELLQLFTTVAGVGTGDGGALPRGGRGRLSAIPGDSLGVCDLQKKTLSPPLTGHVREKASDSTAAL